MILSGDIKGHRLILISMAKAHLEHGSSVLAIVHVYPLNGNVLLMCGKKQDFCNIMLCYTGQNKSF